MKKTSTANRKPTPFFIAFLVIALVFLAVGMGTLGALGSVGEDYELLAPTQSADGTQQSSSVVFALNTNVTENYTDENGEQKTRTVSFMLEDVYLYVDAIYSEAGVPATVTLRHSSGTSADSFFGPVSARLENLYTDAAVEEGSSSSAPALQQDALYRWIHPLKFSAPVRVSTYRYWELSVSGGNVRVAEVLFVGSPADSTGTFNQTKYIIPASVNSATPNSNETREEATARAAVLLDGDLNTRVTGYAKADAETLAKLTYPGEDAIPADAMSSYDTFVKEEIPSLLTITEMRAGTDFLTDAQGKVSDVYHIDTVYNVLGMDLVAFGTVMFGVNPFGLRFMPMLFSFGILVLGFFFVRGLFSKKGAAGERIRNDRAGFVFAVLYALCDLSFSLGHIGTPLTAGLFFLLLAVYCVNTFYRKGIRKVGFAGLAPLLFGGLSAAAAICINGAMLIPVIGVCALYAAGMVRQQKANAVYLERAVEACDAQAEEERDTREVAKVMSENRYKNLAAGFLYPVSLILGVFLFSLIFIVPVYSPLLKYYNNANLASPTMNMFSLGWKAFLGGFVGSNIVGGLPSAWNVFYRIFQGTGETYALTAAVMNPVAALIGLFGIGYAVYKIVRIAKNFSEEGKELRRIVPLLAGVVISLITASFGGGALGFLFLAYIFSFMLAAYAAADCMEAGEGTEKTAKTAKIVTIVALVLLAVCFALFAIFTFSVPVPAGFLGNLF